MEIQIAHKTLSAVNEAIERDQGANFRTILARVLPHIGDAYLGEGKPFRSHLGASLMGRECARSIWYGFRWFKKPHFNGQMIRLFNRGHLEEGRIIAALITAGMRVYQHDANGKQFRVSDAYGHVGGSGDGIVIGCPDLPEGEQALCEFKTYNNKTFTKLKKEGVYLSKPEHYIQMNIYMHKMNIKHALYIAVCKDNDEWYSEIITYDERNSVYSLDRAKEIAFTPLSNPPQKLHNSPAFFDCKFCDFSEICHKNAKPEKNCRTCRYSYPTKRGNGEWMCKKYEIILTTDHQLQGCEKHTYEI